MNTQSNLLGPTGEGVVEVTDMEVAQDLLCLFSVYHMDIFVLHCIGLHRRGAMMCLVVMPDSVN